MSCPTPEAFDASGRLWHTHPHDHSPEVAALPGQHNQPFAHGHLHTRADRGVYQDDYDHHDPTVIQERRTNLERQGQLL